MVRSPGRFDVYFVCFIFSDLSRSDTPENTTLHASVERRGGRGRRRGEEGGLKRKKKKESGGYESKQRRGMTFSIRQRQFYAITSGCRKERRERPVTERETQGGEKDKTSREICLPDSRRKKCAPAAGR